MANWSLFGWSIKRKEEEHISFAPPQNDDGATVVESSAFAGAFGTVLDIDGAVRGEAELITKYRQMSMHPEVEIAVDNIVNEAICLQDGEEIVAIDLDEMEQVPPNIKQVIEQEFDAILKLLDWKINAHDIFKRWYVDGRHYYHCIIDKNRPMDGLKELRYVDPRHIKKVREVKKVKSPEGTATLQKTVAEYYIYNEAGYDSKPRPGAPITTAFDRGLKIAKDAVIYTHSGVLDENGSSVLSYLHKAIRPLNMLRTEEDAAVIYRLVRAPERRIWYIDVGNLPTSKAEQYVHQMMNKYRTKLVYDGSTGTLRDNRKHITMLEDIWLTRREGGRGTQIDTLPGSQNLGQMEEVLYFLKKLYKSLHVPVSRLDPEMTVAIGKATEITRDEVMFAKFIDRLRIRFSMMFIDLLEKQLVLKGVMTPEDWKELKPFVNFKWSRDNDWAEFKELSVMTERMMVLQGVQPYVGRWVSNEWVRKHILRQTEEEMNEIDQQIMMERESEIYTVATNWEGQPVIPVSDPGMNVPPLPPPPEVLNPPQSGKK